MADTDVDFFEEADETTGADKFKAQITNLARQAKNIEGEMESLADRQKELGKQLAVITQQKLPQLLQEAGVKEITTLEGLKVSTKFVVGAIPAESKARAYEWLDEQGHSGIIKRSLSLQFDKGATAAAEEARKKLEELGFTPQSKLDIHPQTFMAFAREQIQTGKLLPLAEWGVYFGDKAVIK